jgi:hypothetical protein
VRIPFILSCSFSLSACEGKKEAVKKKGRKTRSEPGRETRKRRYIFTLFFTLASSQSAAAKRRKKKNEKEKKKKKDFRLKSYL